jgi:hypothetical protein
MRREMIVKSSGFVWGMVLAAGLGNGALVFD